jgi:chemotaxis protein methyltransferase CheR
VDEPSISDREFAQFRDLLHRLTGIHLAPSKKPLLCGRLGRRLRSRSLRSYDDYYALLTSGRDPRELETCVNLLTTNETYFFREPRHFDFLRDQVLPSYKSGRPFRAWSAACATGEEAYSIAMLAASQLGTDAQWEVFGSDINSAVLATATRGQYPIERAEKIPNDYLRQFCLKGVGSQAGTFMVDASLRSHLRFSRVNLNQALPQVGDFDVIFLRNVLIYFQPAVKREVVARLVGRLKSNGFLVVGHSESLHGVSDALRPRAPTVYCRAA